MHSIRKIFYEPGHLRSYLVFRPCRADSPRILCRNAALSDVRATMACTWGETSPVVTHRDNSWWCSYRERMDHAA